MNKDIESQLEQLAYKRSTPFCYSDYIKCPTGVCPQCHSDDLMRITENDGPEFGTKWIYEAILQEELTPVDTECAFEESIRECYPEQTNVGWMTLDTVSVMKEMDPISWLCALSDWESSEEAEANIISLDNGSTYYWRSDVEALLDDSV